MAWTIYDSTGKPVGNVSTNGSNEAVVMLYQRAGSTPVVTDIVDPITYTFATNAITGSIGAWSQSIPAGSNPVYQIQSVAISNSATVTLARSTWTSPVIIAQNGSNGTNGNNGMIVELYQRAASAPAVTDIADPITYTFSTNGISGTIGAWSQNVPAGANPCYRIQAPAISNTTTVNITRATWTTPAIMVQDGVPGVVQGVTAGNSTISMGGTTANPTVSLGTVPESAITNLTTDLANRQPVGIQSIATANGTTTLTNASVRHTVFTGTLSQTIVLPAANTIIVGWQYEIDNASTGLVTVQTNGGAFLTSIQGYGGGIILSCLTIGTAAGTWEIDYGGNVQSRGTQTIASSGGTTQLTAGSPRQTIITGTATQIVILPNAQTLPFLDWGYEIINQSTLTIAVQTYGGTLLLLIPGQGSTTVNCTSIASTAGTWQYLNPIQIASNTPPVPVPLNGLDVWGHSWLENPLTSATLTSLGANSNELFGKIFAASLGIPAARYVQHARTSSMLVGGTRGATTGGGGMAKMLNEISRTRQTMPFVRSGNAHLLCWGINDIGNNTAANQANLRVSAQNILTVLISKARSAAIYNANPTGANIAVGTNWVAATGANDFTSGFARQCTAVDSAGTSTVTFTIPIGYQGEPICFCLGTLSGGSIIVTWGGTAGVTGTTTLSGIGLAANGVILKRITNLTKANSGQTITFAVTTISASTAYFDGVWIEAFKAVPVLVCNCPRLPERRINWGSGAGATTVGTTTFTDNNIQFSNGGVASLYDVGATITETDAQGALTGNTATVSAYVSATQITLGANAAATKSNIQYTINRRIRGYSSGAYWTTNTNFTGATDASHAAADADITNWNTMIATTVAQFDSMVQVVDLDAAIGGDLQLPSNVYTWFSLEGGHLNALGHMRCAQACLFATANLEAPTTDVQPFFSLQQQAEPVYEIAPYRRVIRSGQIYLPDGSNISPVAQLYTAVLGDCFAFPFFVTEASEFWTTVFMNQSNAGTSQIRTAIYDDVGGLNGPTGYPGCVVLDYGVTAMNGSASVTNICPAGINRSVYPGLNWLVVKVDVVGTASTFYTMFGDSSLLPGWNGGHLGTSTNFLQPIAWKVTGVAAGACPGVFPTGGVLVGTNVGATTQFAPVVGVTRTIQ